MEDLFIAWWCSNFTEVYLVLTLCIHWYLAAVNTFKCLSLIHVTWKIRKEKTIFYTVVQVPHIFIHWCCQSQSWPVFVVMDFQSASVGQIRETGGSKQLEAVKLYVPCQCVFFIEQWWQSTRGILTLSRKLHSQGVTPARSAACLILADLYARCQMNGQRGHEEVRGYPDINTRCEAAHTSNCNET